MLVTKKPKPTVYKLKEPVRDVVEAPVDMPAIHKPTMASRFKVALSILAMVVGVLAISRKYLIHNSIRLDESQSLWQTSHSFGGTLRVVASDVHVPLYHIILHFWQFYLGQDIETARALSMIFFIATIPVVYLLARRILSQNWSLLATAFFAFSPFMNWYANEARMYTLLAFMATLSQYFFLKVMDGRKKNGKSSGWFGYSITALIGVYSHYFFAFNLMAQGIFYLLNRKKFPKGTFKRFVALGFGVVAFLSPWLYYFVSLGSASNTTPNLPSPTTVDFFNAFSNFSFGFQTDSANTILVSSWPIIVVVSLLAVKGGQKLDLRTGYIFAAAFLPILLAYGLSFIVSPFFLSRYMLSCVPPLIIMVVWFVSNYGRKLATLVTLALIACIFVTSYQEYTNFNTPVKEDFKGAAQYVTDHATSQDIVVLSAPFTVYPFDYYYKGPTEITTLPYWDRITPGAISPFSDATLPKEVDDHVVANHHYAYVLLSYDQGYEKNIFQYFEGHYTRVQSQKFSDDVTLYVYQVGYKTVTPLNDFQPPAAVPVTSKVKQ